MWCMLASPLMMGCDVRSMNDATKAILLNKDVIAIDQDSLGRQGYRVWRKDGLEAYKKPLSGKKVAIAFLNRNSTPKSMSASWKELELDPKAEYTAYDVWKHAALPQPMGLLSADLQPHECQVIVLTLMGRK
jgi:alpha-galactosidase